MPHERKLTGEVKDKAKSWLEMKANKKLVQEALCAETGNVILLKDLSNLVNRRERKNRNDLDAVVQLLMDKYGELYELASSKCNAGSPISLPRLVQSCFLT